MSRYFNTTDTEDALEPSELIQKEDSQDVSEFPFEFVFSVAIKSKDEKVFDEKHLIESLESLSFIKRTGPVLKEYTEGGHFISIHIFLEYSSEESPQKIIRTITTSVFSMDIAKNPFLQLRINKRENPLDLSREVRFDFSRDLLTYLCKDKSVLKSMNMLDARRLIGLFSRLCPKASTEELEKCIILNFKDVLPDVQEHCLKYGFKHCNQRVSMPVEGILINPLEFGKPSESIFYFENMLSTKTTRNVFFLPAAISSRHSIAEQKEIIENFPTKPVRDWMFKWFDNTIILAGNIGMYNIKADFSRSIGYMFVVLTLRKEVPAIDSLRGTSLQQYAGSFQRIIDNIVSDPANLSEYKRLTYHH